MTHLLFGGYFNQEIDNCIPNSVTHLTFSSKFNKSIDNFLVRPDKSCDLIYLKFVIDFNTPITTRLPNSLKYLIFGWSFNQSIAFCLPNSITHLHFDHNFNQPIKNYIPNSVTDLTFGAHFYRSVNVPKSVVCLRFNGEYNRSIQNEQSNLRANLICSQNIYFPIKECNPCTSSHQKLCNVSKMYRGTTLIWLYGQLSYVWNIITKISTYVFQKM